MAIDARTLEKTREVLSDDETSFVSVLCSISKTSRALLGFHLAPVGLVVGQDQLLVALDPGKPCLVSSVAQDLNVRSSTVSKMVDRLAEKGLVERHGDTTDARRVVIRITEAGLLVRRRIAEVYRDVEADLRRGLASDGETALSTLVRVDDLLHRRLSRHR